MRAEGSSHFVYNHDVFGAKVLRLRYTPLRTTGEDELSLWLVLVPLHEGDVSEADRGSVLS